MGNRPAINFGARSPAPGADAEAYGRYRKWWLEVYSQILIKSPKMLGNDHYQIVRVNLEYPEMIMINHYKNLEDMRTHWASSESAITNKEVDSWRERGIIEQIWSAAYALMRSFRSSPASTGNEDTRIDNAPIMHMEAYRLSPEEQERYAKWFYEYGPPIFIPLFMKLPGLKGYDFYEDTGLRRRQDARELKNPKYLSIIYFESMKAYEDFIKSPELAGFHKAMRSVFPRGLKYEWYVQYQLIQSRRK